MKKEQYSVYLKSEHWLEVKAKFYLRERNRRCFVCGDNRLLNIHHKTYKRIGMEFMSDLVALCRKCHEGVHKLRSKEKVPLFFAHKRYKQSLKGTMPKKNNHRKTDQSRNLRALYAKKRRGACPKVNIFTSEQIEEYKKRMMSS